MKAQGQKLYASDCRLPPAGAVGLTMADLANRIEHAAGKAHTLAALQKTRRHHAQALQRDVPGFGRDALLLLPMREHGHVDFPVEPLYGTLASWFSTYTVDGLQCAAAIRTADIRQVIRTIVVRLLTKQTREG